MKMICTKKIRRFTLIELLIVMALMGMMISVAIPSFTHMAKSKTLSQAVTEISGQIQIARTYALVNHCYTAVVFPTRNDLTQIFGSASTMDKSPISSYYNASCRIAVVDKDSSGKFFFVMWLPGSQWTLLPRGAFIPDGNTNFPTVSAQYIKDVPFGALSRLYKTYTNSKAVPDTQYKGNIQRFVAIRSNGQIVNEGNEDLDEHAANDSMTIKVTDGVFDPRKGQYIKQKRAKNTQHYQVMKINYLSARIQVSSENSSN